MDLVAELQNVEGLLQQKIDDDEEKNELLLKVANIHFRLGHIKQCEQTLNQVCFSGFDFREWIVESNQLLRALQKSQRIGSASECVKEYCNLVQKIQGLPPMRQHIVDEMTITYNCSFLLLTHHDAHHDAVSCNRCAAVLISGIDRAAKLLLPSRHQPTNWSLHKGDQLSKMFFHETLTQVISWVKDLLESFNDEESLELGGLQVILVLSCCLFAVLWMSEDQADKANELLLTVDNYLKNNNGLEKQGKKRAATILLLQGRGPVELTLSDSRQHCKSSEESVYKYIQGQTVKSLRKSARAAHILRHNLQPIRNSLSGRNRSQHRYYYPTPCEKFGRHYLFLAGILSLLIGETRSSIGNSFEEEPPSGKLYSEVFLVVSSKCEFDSSLKCLQETVQSCSLEEYQKAAALNVIGCCCAENNKPHTAIQMFKEAIQCNVHHLAPLYNIAIQYRKLAEFDAEISTLRMLIDAMQLAASENQLGDTGSVWEMSSCNLEVRELIVPRPRAFLSTGSAPCCEFSTETVMYTLAKRYMELDRFSEAADAFLDLLAVLLESNVLPSGMLHTIPSPSVLYQECAYSLLCDGRYDDAVIVCDRALQPSATNTINPQHTKQSKENQTLYCFEKMKPSKKRPRESALDEAGEKERSCKNIPPHQDSVLHMYKADALVQLGQPVMALESLDRCLDILEQQKSDSKQKATTDYITDEVMQNSKRRRVDSEGSAAYLKRSQGVESFKVSKIAQAQAQAWNNKAIIAMSLGNDADALEMFHQALRCDQSHIEAVFNHTLLLWKLGKKLEGACNWLRFRGCDVKLEEQTGNHLSFLSDLRLVIQTIINTWLIGRAPN